MLQLIPLFFTLLCIGLGDALDGRIVNGQNTTIDKYPYQGSLRMDGYHYCGCSLLSPQVVLTAAHCTDKRDVSKMTVHFGSSHYYDTVGQIVKVKEIRQHENFALPAMDSDVALLVLDERITTGPFVQTIPMATVEPKVGEMAVVTGWGLLKDGVMVLPEWLQKLEVPIFDRNTCNAIYGGKISQRMICAGFEQGGKDSCQGDSGGPLAINGVQVGIVSWAYGCAKPFYVGVYTNIAKVYDWIKDHSVV